MARTDFEKLEVYLLAEKLADQVWVIVAKWPLFARDTIGKQLVRAADSVGPNISEGTGRKAFQGNRRFVRIAVGRCTKHNTGCDVHLFEDFSINAKLTTSSGFWTSSRRD